MLEKEFGPKTARKGKGKGGDDGEDDDQEDSEVVPIGGVNAKGRLVLPWRKTRVTTRWLQCFVSITAAGCGLGGYIMIHPKEKAPPSGTMPSFVLYGVSALSTIVCLWLFALKPCCRPSRHTDVAAGGFGGGGHGMVIPVMTGGHAGHKGGFFGGGKSTIKRASTTLLQSTSSSILPFSASIPPTTPIRHRH